MHLKVHLVAGQPHTQNSTPSDGRWIYLHHCTVRPFFRFACDKIIKPQMPIRIDDFIRFVEIEEKKRGRGEKVRIMSMRQSESKHNPIKLSHMQMNRYDCFVRNWSSISMCIDQVPFSVGCRSRLRAPSMCCGWCARWLIYVESERTFAVWIRAFERPSNDIATLGLCAHGMAYVMEWNWHK